jgi:hypothetical protein
LSEPAADDKEGSLQYQFISPSRREQFRQHAELSKSAERSIPTRMRASWST